MCKKNTNPTAVVKALGLSESSLNRWRNNSIPNGETIILLAQHLGCSTDYLLLGKELQNNLIINDMSNEEISLIEMYRLLPVETKKFIFDSIENNYDRNKLSSIYNALPC